MLPNSKKINQNTLDFNMQANSVFSTQNVFKKSVSFRGTLHLPISSLNSQDHTTVLLLTVK